MRDHIQWIALYIYASCSVQKKFNIVFINYKIKSYNRNYSSALFSMNYFYNKNITNAFFAPLESKTLEIFFTSLYKFA